MGGIGLSTYCLAKGCRPLCVRSICLRLSPVSPFSIQSSFNYNNTQVLWTLRRRSELGTRLCVLCVAVCCVSVCRCMCAVCVQCHGWPLPLQIIVTNTLPTSEQSVRCSKIRTIDVSMLLGEAIRRVHYGESMSYLFANVPGED